MSEAILNLPSLLTIQLNAEDQQMTPAHWVVHMSWCWEPGSDGKWSLLLGNHVVGANAAPEVSLKLEALENQSHCALIFSLMGTWGPFTRLQPKS